MTARIPWGKVDAYCRHAVAVALGFAGAVGILDPITGMVSISNAHALEVVAMATGFQLLANYAGLPVTRPKVRRL